METKGDRLRAFAKASSGALSSMADALGIEPQQMQPYVSNKRFPKHDILEKLAAMGCNVHWLLTGQGEMYADNEAGRELRKKHAPQDTFDENTVASMPIAGIQKIQQTPETMLPERLTEIENDIKQVLLKIQSMMK